MSHAREYKRLLVNIGEASRARVHRGPLHWQQSDVAIVCLLVALAAAAGLIYASGIARGF